MAIKRPDIYEHNNSSYAIADSNFVRGSFRTAVADLTALYALSGKTDQLKERATFVYVTSENKYYELISIANVGNSSGWQVFIGGGGGANLITGATNGLTVNNNTVKLGGNLCEGTTINTLNNTVYFRDSASLNSYVQMNLSNIFNNNVFQVYYDDSGSTASSHFCVLPTCNELYVSSDANNCSSLYLNTSCVNLTSKNGGTTHSVVLNGNALCYGGNYSSSFVARSIPDVGYVTGITSPISSCFSNYYNKTQINTYTGTTAPNTYLTKTAFNTYTGTTAPNTYLTKTAFNTYSGTTIPNTYYNKSCINNYTGATNTRISNVETITNSAVTGATNGLTKIGRNVVLGGSLTGNTSININAKNLTFSGTSGNVLSCVGSSSAYGYSCVTKDYVTLETLNSSNFAYVDLNRSGNTITSCTKGGNLLFNTTTSSGIGGCMVITAQSGATYAACYHNNYTNRSLVDKEFVINRINALNVRYTIPNHDSFYLNACDNYIGVSGYSLGSCACIYLVPSPTLQLGQKVIVADIQGNALDYPITIDGNGKCINGLTSGTAMINTDYGSITFVYNGLFWSAVAFVN